MKDSLVGESYHPISPADFDWSSWVGFPYQKFGRGPLAYDCWGLVCAVIQAGLGVTLPAFLDYSPANIPDAISEYSQLDHWSLAQGVLKPWDVVIFTTANDPHHVGVVCAPGQFLHLARESESMIERLTSRRWARRIEGGYRYDLL